MGYSLNSGLSANGYVRTFPQNSDLSFVTQCDPTEDITHTKYTLCLSRDVKNVRRTPLPLILHHDNLSEPRGLYFLFPDYIGTFTIGIAGATFHSFLTFYHSRH